MADATAADALAAKVLDKAAADASALHIELTTLRSIIATRGADPTDGTYRSAVKAISSHLSDADASVDYALSLLPSV